MRLFSLLLITSIIFIMGYSCKEPNKSSFPTPYTLQIPSHFPPMNIPEDNPMTVEGVALGRMLFWDPMLSGNNTMSCGTCHAPQAAFADTNQFSQGITGAFGTRNSMALINLGWQQFFFWDGRTATLEDQIFQPVTNPIEMNDTWPNVVNKLSLDAEYPALFEGAFGESGIDSVKVSKAIAQFLRTMISGNSDFDIIYKFKNGISMSVSELDRYNNISIDAKDGYDIFLANDSADCFHCHPLPLTHIQEFSNNGLDFIINDSGRYHVTGNLMDIGKFKVPTLRNIELSYPYMHDGRFQTIEDVVFHYFYTVVPNSPNIDGNMEHAGSGGVGDGNFLGDFQTAQVIMAKLVLFLKSMTDTEYINNPDFQDPH